MPDKQPIIDFDPTPGHLLIKPLKREEVAALYNRSKSSNLSLPDNVGKVSDSVGVGQVIKMAPPSVDKALEIDKLYTDKSNAAKDEALRMFQHGIKVGDYVAHMPYTDLIIEIDGVKYSLLPYDKVWAVRKGGE